MGRFKNFVKNNRFFQYSQLELGERLTVIFLVTGGFMSMIGFLLGLVFGAPMVMIIPHLFIVLMCLILPIIFKDNFSKAAMVALCFVAALYFPFLFFANGGNEGSAPIYFAMIIIYFSFYLSRIRLIGLNLILIIYYISIMAYAYLNPGVVIPMPDEFSQFVDKCVAVGMVAIVMSIVAQTTFVSYQKEKEKSAELLKELEQRNKDLENLTIHDSLTGVYTRRHFMKTLKEISQLSKEDDQKLYIFMLDIDNFKEINDTYGHLYGDSILRKVAHVIKENIRDFDVVARYGGEEFIMLVSASNDKGAYRIGERIRKNVERLEHRHSEPVTVSIGLVEMTADMKPYDPIQIADEKLYEAKNSGRNRIAV